MGSLNSKKQARLKRKKRIRKRVSGTSERPRLSVFRSAKHIYVQVIDDISGKTLVAASTGEKAIKASVEKGEHLGAEEGSPCGKVAVAKYVGKLAAERVIEKGIRKVVFDRNGFLYHGRIKAVSDGAREAGLDF